MGKILLFYKYVTLEDPQLILKWQRALCEKLGIKGRIILATEGINATVGGMLEATEEYKKTMEEHPLFKNIDFKESDGDADYFPRLRIVVKNEIVHLGLDTQVIRAQDGGIHLSPTETHTLITNNKNLVILDGRNNYESRVGAFTNALKPDITNFREFPEYVDHNKEQFKDKEILMYCTGGIRCERASTYLKSKGIAKEVYQINGGIHRYIEQFPDGYFRGKNYVFDDRVTVRVNNDVLTNCDLCGSAYDEYTNCLNAVCNKQTIACPACIITYENTCSAECHQLVRSGSVPVRSKSRHKPSQTNACSL